MPELQQTFFTPKEIATYLGLSTYTVQQLCREGRLQHTRFKGNKIRIKKEWADQFMRSGERPLLR
jgi:excisionase family DNA binding protein